MEPTSGRTPAAFAFAVGGLGDINGHLASLSEMEIAEDEDFVEFSLHRMCGIIRRNGKIDPGFQRSTDYPALLGGLESLRDVPAQREQVIEGGDDLVVLPLWIDLRKSWRWMESRPIEVAPCLLRW